MLRCGFSRARSQRPHMLRSPRSLLPGPLLQPLRMVSDISFSERLMKAARKG